MRRAAKKFLVKCSGFLLALLSICSPYTTEVAAHDARPIVVSIEKEKNGVAEINIRVPASIERQHLPLVKLQGCLDQHNGKLTQIFPYRSGGDYRYSYKLNCPPSLAEHQVHLDFPTYNPSLSTVLNFTLPNGEVHTTVLAPGQTLWRLENRSFFLAVAADYGYLGMAHILGGIDHLMFITCLMIIAWLHNRKRLLQRIILITGGFTIAHSLTLILSTLGFVKFSASAIEAIIALSIVVMAAEIIRQEFETLIWQRPAFIASLFGFLHGLGFASGLAEIGLPQSFKLTALLFFNIGVEIGQMLFIFIALGLCLFTERLISLFPNNTSPCMANELMIRIYLPIYLIGTISSYWFIERSLRVFL